MTTTTRKAPSDVARDVLEVFNATTADRATWSLVLDGLEVLSQDYRGWAPDMVRVALATLGVPSVSLKTDHSKPGSVKGVRRADVEAALVLSPFTPTAERPLAKHVLRAVINETSRLYRDEATADYELTIGVECQLPAAHRHDCTDLDNGYCEASEFIGEDDVANYRGVTPVELRPGAEVVVWREAVKPVEGCAPYAWRWRYAEDA